MNYPLILVTNDDGIHSPGLWATVEAVLPLGEVLIVAPDRQWSGAGRALPHQSTGAFCKKTHTINGVEVTAYAVDGSPAQTVQHGVLELAPRVPSLVVSGINSGANLSIEVTISGTVGAALEAGAFGIPALAVSLEMDQRFYLTGNAQADYAAAQLYIHQFGQQLLAYGLPYGTDVLNINIPANATPDTPYRYTRLSRHRYFVPVAPDRERTGEGKLGYRHINAPKQTEFDSDIRAVVVDKVVSVTPLSLNMTAQAAYLNASAGIFQTAEAFFNVPL